MQRFNKYNHILEKKMTKTRKARRFIPIDTKITAAQETVVKARARLDRAVKTLELLMEKREKFRCKELMDAVKQSEHSYEEILCFIRG